jgi:hypothetical protein
MCINTSKVSGSVNKHLGYLETQASNEQSIASKSPISRFRMVALLRRLDEFGRYGDKEP